MSARTSAPFLSLLLALPGLFVVSPAFAQELDNEVSVQRFDPAPGAGNFLTTRSAGVSGHLSWTAGMFVNYGYQPFVVKRCVEAGCPEESTETIPVVENMVTGDILGSLSLIERLQVGLKIPVSWAKGQGITETGNPQPDGLSAVGLGDVQLEVKGRIYGNPGEMIVLGGYLYGTAPTGTITAEGSYIGNSSPTFGGAAILDGKVGPFTYGVNLGGIVRNKATIGGATEVGSEFRWNAAVGYAISPIIRVVADGFGSTGFSSDLGSNTAEVDLGAHILPLGNQLTFTVGGGAGVLKGVGLPTARAFIGVLYNATTQDRDGDGIPDDKDGCPDAAEDMDGYEDGDGCPELDNDLDGLPDEADKCPNEPEDVDGFEDNDGCPDPDNDKDGILDKDDHCPDEPETKNGVDDLDGCPDQADQDGDGVPDDVDQCPTEPEDTDGFEDTDGCPDPDNDGDGIPDESDECIGEPEDGKGKGKEKEDGCPLDS